MTIKIRNKTTEKISLEFDGLYWDDDGRVTTYDGDEVVEPRASITIPCEQISDLQGTAYRPSNGWQSDTFFGNETIEDGSTITITGDSSGFYFNC